MYVHEEVLNAAIRICRERKTWTFTPNEIVHALPHKNANAVRTHVVSRCCVNAPKNHPHKWDYFRRTGRGKYEITSAYRQRREAAGTKRHPPAATSAPRDTVHVIISNSGDVYVAECFELSVVTQGHTLDETMANLREAVDLHLEGEDPSVTGVVSRPRLVVTYETALVG